MPRVWPEKEDVTAPGKSKADSCDQILGFGKLDQIQ